MLSVDASSPLQMQDTFHSAISTLNVQRRTGDKLKMSKGHLQEISKHFWKGSVIPSFYPVLPCKFFTPQFSFALCLVWGTCASFVRCRSILNPSQNEFPQATLFLNHVDLQLSIPPLPPESHLPHSH